MCPIRSSRSSSRYQTETQSISKVQSINKTSSCRAKDKRTSLMIQSLRADAGSILTLIVPPLPVPPSCHGRSITLGLRAEVIIIVAATIISMVGTVETVVTIMPALALLGSTRF